jgi:hypothetical protein
VVAEEDRRPLGDRPSLAQVSFYSILDIVRCCCVGGSCEIGDDRMNGQLEHYQTLWQWTDF